MDNKKSKIPSNKEKQMNTLREIINNDKELINAFIQEKNHEKALAIFNLINEYTGYYKDSITYRLREDEFSRITGTRMRYKELNGFLRILHLYLLSAGLKVDNDERNGNISRKEIETILNYELIRKAGFSEDKKSLKTWLSHQLFNVPDYIIRTNKKYYKIIKKIGYEVISN